VSFEIYVCVLRAPSPGLAQGVWRREG
jgi:hypothetical protein